MKPVNRRALSQLSAAARFLRPRFSFLSRWAGLILITAGSWSGRGQSDDFDGGTDQGWTRANSLAIIGVTPSFTFPSDGFGGKAYRIQAPAPPVADAGPARAGSYRTNIYTDFFAAVDVLAWDNDLNQSFGFLFRAENIGLAQTTGYVLNYNPQQATGGRGQIQINRVTGEQPSGTVGSANITLDPTRRYRFVLTAIGPDLTARVYDLADLTAPLTQFAANDSTYVRGVVALFDFYRGNSTIDPAAGRADVTFDNYLAAAVTPPSVSLPGTPHSVSGMPQVVNRSPTNRANFYPAANGIRFTVSTLSTNRIDPSACRMRLNGADVWPNAQTSGTSSNLNVIFNGLVSNKVYDALVVLQDLAGRRSTNEWTFDTFTEDYLNSPEVKIIEAEDYNYAGGKFQDNPPPSGLSSAGELVNGNGAGYYDAIGTLGVDYFDNSTQAGGGANAEFRLSDFTGTQAGSMETAGLDAAVANDTRRQKYLKLDLPEYQVARTEGGEWLNYTRTFAVGTFYAYLRVACRASQTVNLDQVTSDRTQPNQTTTPLGTFQVPSTGLLANYRYVPLTDAAGKQATVNLSGVQTLRLTLGGPAQNATQYTMALNYLLFVPTGPAPATVQLESSLNVAGPYAVDAAAVLNENNGTIAVPLNNGWRFFRLRANGASPKIAKVQIVNGSLVIQYGLFNF